MINVKVAGTKTSNARDTPGGTWSGILMHLVFQRTKKGKVNERRLLFLRHSMNIVVKKISKRRMTL